MKVVAENIRKIINERGLKQMAVSSKAGYEYQTFNNMLNGRKEIMDYDIAKITEVLDVTPNELFSVTTDDIYEAGSRKEEV